MTATMSELAKQIVEDTATNRAAGTVETHKHRLKNEIWEYQTDMADAVQCPMEQDNTGQQQQVQTTE